MEKNNCFTRSGLNKIGKETDKKYDLFDVSKNSKVTSYRIFKYGHDGNSQVYHFANNSVMDQNETVKTLNCFLNTREEK